MKSLYDSNEAGTSLEIRMLGGQEVKKNQEQRMQAVEKLMLRFMGGGGLHD